MTNAMAPNRGEISAKLLQDLCEARKEPGLTTSELATIFLRSEDHIESRMQTLSETAPVRGKSIGGEQIWLPVEN